MGVNGIFRANTSSFFKGKPTERSVPYWGNLLLAVRNHSTESQVNKERYSVWYSSHPTPDSVCVPLLKRFRRQITHLSVCSANMTWYQRVVLLQCSALPIIRSGRKYNGLYIIWTIALLSSSHYMGIMRIIVLHLYYCLKVWVQ